MTLSSTWEGRERFEFLFLQYFVLLLGKRTAHNHRKDVSVSIFSLILPTLLFVLLKSCLGAFCPFGKLPRRELPPVTCCLQFLLDHFYCLSFEPHLPDGQLQKERSLRLQPLKEFHGQEQWYWRDPECSLLIISIQVLVSHKSIPGATVGLGEGDMSTSKGCIGFPFFSFFFLFLSCLHGNCMSCGIIWEVLLCHATDLRARDRDRGST